MRIPGSIILCVDPEPTNNIQIDLQCKFSLDHWEVLECSNKTFHIQQGELFLDSYLDFHILCGDRIYVPVEPGRHSSGIYNLLIHRPHFNEWYYVHLNEVQSVHRAQVMELCI